MAAAAFPTAMLAGIIAGWELVLVISVIVILFGAKNLPGAADELGQGLSQGLGFFKRAFQGFLDELTRDPRFHRPDYRGEAHETTPMKSFAGANFVLWIAQGFGVGRVCGAPGTFGSVLGLFWFCLLLWTRSFWLYLACVFSALAFSVLICDAAEKILKQTDPSSVVLDEIVAVPLCFAGWVGWLFFQSGHMPNLVSFFGDDVWYKTVAVFAAFRFFDIAKPWPIRQSQKLPGGWGVTIDDLLAAVYVNLACFLFWAIKELLLSRA